MLTIAFAGSLMGCTGEPSAIPDTPPSRAPTEPSEQIALALQVPPSQVIDHVDYTVFGNGQFQGGLVDTSDPNATPTAEFGLPAGSGYTVSLSAVSRAGVHCSGSKTFSVTAGAENTVDVDVLCDPTNQGDDVGGTVTGGAFIPGNAASCPEVAFYTASALSVSSLGGEIWLTGNGTAGTTGAFWTVSTGPAFLADPAAASTILTCTGPGSVTVSFTVTDGESCVDSKNMTLACVAPTACGNGVLEPGEGCEPPGTAACDSNCHVVLCGNGVVDPGEGCEPPNTASCDAICQPRVCGNGVVDPGEACDPPNTATCDSLCQLR